MSVLRSTCVHQYMYVTLGVDRPLWVLWQTMEGNTMPVSVWTSTLKRTIQTAELLPFPKLRWKVCPRLTALPEHFVRN